MNDDMPWVIGLSDEEVQELRKNKQELTEYGKGKIRELMNDGKLRFYDKGKETLTIDDSSWGKVQTPEMKLEVKEMTHEEMLEEAAKREAANQVIIAKVSEEDYRKVQEEIANKKAWAAVEKLYDENGDALQQLAEIEKEELIVSRKNRAQQVMNEYYAKLGSGPYYYDNSAVAAALREAVEGLNIEPDPDRELSMEKHYFIKGQNWVKDAILNLAVELEVEEL